VPGRLRTFTENPVKVAQACDLRRVARWRPSMCDTASFCIIAICTENNTNCFDKLRMPKWRHLLNGCYECMECVNIIGTLADVMCAKVLLLMIFYV
jgi:hypothetical protein